MKGLLKVFAIALFALFSACLQAQPIKITDIRIVQEFYSYKKLEANIQYDGSLGQGLLFGATAETPDPVNGISYTPSSLSQNVQLTPFTVSRPALIGKSATASTGIDFSFYGVNRREAFRTTPDFAMEWKSLVDYFELTPTYPRQSFLSIREVTFDEAIFDARLILQKLAAAGIDTQKVTVNEFYTTSPNNEIGIRFSEDLLIEDFRKILDILISANANLVSIGFDRVGSTDFVPGRLAIQGSIRAGDQVFIDRTMLLTLANASGMEDVFNLLGLTFTPPDMLISGLLDKAELFNAEDTASAGRNAYDLASYVLQRDPSNIQALLVTASALFRINPLEDALIKATAVIDTALESAPQNPDVLTYKAYLLTMIEMPQEAIEYFERAKEYFDSPDSNYLRERARNYLMLGDYDNAVLQYQTLLGLNLTGPGKLRAQYWGLVEYLSLIRNSDSPDVGPVYEKLIADFPERGACNKLGYAQHLLYTSPDTLKVVEMLSDASVRNCQGKEQIVRLLSIIDWSERTPDDKSMLSSLMFALGDAPVGIAQLAQLQSAAVIMPQIVAHDIDINEQNDDGMAALHIAVASGRSGAVAVLLSNSADVDLPTISGATPLMLAVYFQNAEMVRLLLDSGADVTLADDEGTTALSIATESGNEEIISLLQAAVPAI